MQSIQLKTVRTNVRLLLEQCHIPYKVIPFDEELYQKCLDDGVRRGYPPLESFTRMGVMYAATAGAHLPHRQIWVAQYTTCAIFVDDFSSRFQSDLPDLYLFNDRFIRGEPQGSAALEMFADLIRRASDIYLPIAAQLLTSSTLAYVTATLLEYETRSMKILNAAQQYPTYQRTYSGDSEAYSFMVFPKEIPLNDYIQAIPEMSRLLDNVNDILSFYKEEQTGDTTNQISTLAARTGKSKLEVFDELTETTIDLHKRIVEILEGSPEACKAFKCFASGYVYFHTSTGRYRMHELDL